MGLRDWVSEKAARYRVQPRGSWWLQWGSETGSRRRGHVHRHPVAPRPASMGLRDWVSEKVNGEDFVAEAEAKLQWGSETGSRRRATGSPAASCAHPLASMGLRDWVSEKVAIPIGTIRQIRELQWGSETGSRRRSAGPIWPTPSPARFNGAPRLGLGEGSRPWTPPTPPRWRFNGAPRLGLGEGRRWLGGRSRTSGASMGLRDWVSEKGPRGPGQRVRARRFNGAPRLGLGEGFRPPLARPPRKRFNGAPRLGLGEGLSRGDVDPVSRQASMGLRDWVSEKAPWDARPSVDGDRASMGLRDWVSEKVHHFLMWGQAFLMLQWGSETGSRRRAWAITALGKDCELQWGSETGSRRRRAAPGVGLGVGDASMGLRDWVSEKGRRSRRGRYRDRSFNGAPRLGLGEGWVDRPSCTRMPERWLQWGSETGSRRRPLAAATSEAECRRRASMGLRDWVSEKDLSTHTKRASVTALLQWGSETGSRRRGRGRRGALSTIGLQWGSETGSRRREPKPRPTVKVGEVLQWGSETGSRRRGRAHAEGCPRQQASMGLRDWVSEKAPAGLSFTR